MIKKTVSKLEKICSRAAPLAQLYSYPYRRVVKKEIELAGISSHDTVLNIGCGAVPFTAIWIARLTKAQVIAADKDQRAIDLAHGCVHKLGLQDRIKPVVCDGAEWVPEGFTVAVIALQAEPKAAIFSNVYQAKGNNIRIVSRAPSRLFESHYGCFPESFAAVAEVSQNMKTFDRSVLFLV